MTIQAYSEINIEELLNTIVNFESQLAENINVDVVNTLMSLYQKAIEYYSA